MVCEMSVLSISGAAFAGKKDGRLLKKFVFSLEMVIFKLKICIFSLEICIFRLEI